MRSLRKIGNSNSRRKPPLAEALPCSTPRLCSPLLTVKIRLLAEGIINGARSMLKKGASHLNISALNFLQIRPNRKNFPFLPGEIIKTRDHAKAHHTVNKFDRVDEIADDIEARMHEQFLSKAISSGNEIIIVADNTDQSVKLAEWLRGMPSVVYHFSDLKMLFEWLDLRAENITSMVIDCHFFKPYEISVALSDALERAPWIGVVAIHDIGAAHDEEYKAIKDICHVTIPRPVGKVTIKMGVLLSMEKANPD